jgi:hypothetical protein
MVVVGESITKNLKAFNIQLVYDMKALFHVCLKNRQNMLGKKKCHIYIGM